MDCAGLRPALLLYSAASELRRYTATRVLQWTPRLAASIHARGESHLGLAPVTATCRGPVAIIRVRPAYASPSETPVSWFGASQLAGDLSLQCAGRVSPDEDRTTYDFLHPIQGNAERRLLRDHPRIFRASPRSHGAERARKAAFIANKSSAQRKSLLGSRDDNLRPRTWRTASPHCARAAGS